MTTISSLPAVPSRGNPATFSTQFEAFLTALKSVFVGQVNAVAGEINASATAASGSASAANTAKTAAQAAQAAAEQAQIAAAASTNFKGNWSALTGALAVPASVAHAGFIWTLLSNVADVTAKQPGVAAEWQVVGRGVQQVVVGNATTAFSTTSNSFVSTGLSASITPKSASSKIVAVLLINTMNWTSSPGDAYLFRGSTMLLDSYLYVTNTTYGTPRMEVSIDYPGVTSALTYSLKTRSAGGGTMTFHGMGIADNLILMEVL